MIVKADFADAFLRGNMKEFEKKYPGVIVSPDALQKADNLLKQVSEHSGKRKGDSFSPEAITRDLRKINRLLQGVNENFPPIEVPTAPKDMSLKALKQVDDLFKQTPDITNTERIFFNETGTLVIAFNNDYVCYFGKPGEPLKKVEGKINVYRGSGDSFLGTGIELNNLRDAERNHLNQRPFWTSE